MAFLRLFSTLGFSSILFVVLSFLPLTAQKIPPHAGWGAQTWGRAGVGAPLAQGLEAFSNNPAGLTRQIGRASFGGSYLSLPQKASSWNIGLIDGLQQVIGGFNFHWYEESPFNRQSYQLGLAYTTTYGAAGISADIYRFSGLDAPDNGWKVSQSAGALIPIAYGLQIGAFSQAFFDTIRNEIQAPLVALGAAYDLSGMGRVGFQADRSLGVSDVDWNYSIGGDIILQEFFVARTGYRFDNSGEKNFWTIGAGLESPKLNFDAFYRLNADNSGQRAWGFELQFLF